MERVNKKIYTKENPIKKVNEKLYPIEKEDRQIMRLEKTCDILSIALKVEVAITLAVMTFCAAVNGFPSIDEIEAEYKSAGIVIENDNNEKI